MDKAEEEQAVLAKGKRKKRTRGKLAPPVPEESLTEPDPAPLDNVTEISHRPETAPAEIGPFPRNRSPAPQAEDVRHKKSRRSRGRKIRQDGQGTANPEQPQDPPPDNVEPAAEAASLNILGDCSNSPKTEVIDLTIKEESRPGTPILPLQDPGSKEGPAGFKAGWVRFPGILSSDPL